MWESPIRLIEQEMQMQLEGDVMKAVQNVGVTVDKEELLRALQYDREQYYRGYNDAIKEFAEEIKRYIAVEYGLTDISLGYIDMLAERMKGGAE
jgi:hypothetical protein